MAARTPGTAHRAALVRLTVVAMALLFGGCGADEAGTVDTENAGSGSPCAPPVEVGIERAVATCIAAVLEMPDVAIVTRRAAQHPALDCHAADGTTRSIGALSRLTVRRRGLAG